MKEGFPLTLMDFRIRAVREGDEHGLSTFYGMLSPRSRYFFEPYHDTSVDAMREIVERGLCGADLHCVAEEASGAIFSHIFYRNVSAPVPHLGIGVLDSYQNHGIGGVLLQYLICLGKYHLRKQAIGLTVMKENLRAFHLYQKLGFRVVRDDVSFRSTADSYEMHLVFSDEAK